MSIINSKEIHDFFSQQKSRKILKLFSADDQKEGYFRRTDKIPPKKDDKRQGK